MVKEGKKTQQQQKKNQPTPEHSNKITSTQKLLPNTSVQMFKIWNKRSHLPVWVIIMYKSFMVKVGRQNVFFFNGFFLLIVWGTIALNMLLHQKAPIILMCILLKVICSKGFHCVTLIPSSSKRTKAVLWKESKLGQTVKKKKSKVPLCFYQIWLLQLFPVSVF